MSTTWNETTATPTIAQELPLTAPPLALPAKKVSRAKILLPALVTLAAAVGGGMYLHGLGTETTDDAQVEGHIFNVAARIAGQVKEVRVRDNQLVEAGDVLVEIDDRDLDAKLLGARADLASAEAGLSVAKAQLALTERSVAASLSQAKGGLVQASSGWASTRALEQQTKADVTAAESRKALAAIELQRAEALRAQDAASQAEVDAKRAALDQANAQIEQARARVSGVDANAASTAGMVQSAQGRLAAAETGPEQLEAARAQVAVAEARVKQAEAALRIAELNLSYTKIKAPVRGAVSRRSVEPGQMISPERPLFALVPPDDVWVVANFKEDQLAEMRPGQRVIVKIDTYGRRAFAGHVESLAGASGARFALLPPDNASGNFVKVVQRVPVLVRLEAPPDVPFRPGMSAFVSVSTRDR